ncbi:MAG: pyridoxal phosphate-dependent decarboxylase family protein [Woeseiaceae bacterium]
MSDYAALDRAVIHAQKFLDSLDERPVAVTATVQELRTALDKQLSEHGMAPSQVIDELARDAEAGLLGSTTGRFFGWVIGGNLPAALAADWLTSAWDQNGATYAVSPASSVVEEVAGRWLKEILRLPEQASFAFVTGCQMAHVTALAAARHQVLVDRGWDVTRQGLAGAPPIRILTSELRHESFCRAVGLLGLGLDNINYVPVEQDGRMSVAALASALETDPKRPTIVCLQAGDLNTGQFDDYEAICPLAHKHNAWVHIDGAFGLWAAASDNYRHLLRGAGLADSWATDAHKWLNVPYDSGIVFVANPQAQMASLTTRAGYFVAAPESARDQVDWNPEWSRRSRGFALYAALRELGQNGVADIVDRCCRATERLVDGIDAMDGAEKLAQPIINQGLVRFLDSGGNHDARTDQVIERIRDAGIVWFGGTDWHGKRAMRISVCNYRTTDRDIERALTAVNSALHEGVTGNP